MKYIVIEREYGSGGTKIGEKLAEKSRIPCYGQEILNLVSKRMHVSPDQIRNYEEKATNSILYSLYLFSQSQTGNSDMLSQEGKVFVEEQNAIRELAKQSSAIFLGHCASEALKECGNVIRVYIHADTETKRQRIKEDYGIAEDSIDAIMKKNNKRRASYYAANTQSKWDNFRNYQIVLDSGTLGIDGCVKILESCLDN